MAIRAKYVGEGQFYPGLPADDITDEVWGTLTKEQRDLVRASSIYEVSRDTGHKEPLVQKEK